MDVSQVIFQNHPLTWMASVLCCTAVLILLFKPVTFAKPIYESNTFLPTYTIGILAWLLHGIEIESLALILPSMVQLLALLFLVRRALLLRESISNGL